MKAGRTLQELVSELDRQAASKRDYLADTRKLSAKPASDGVMLLEGVNGGMPLRDTAHSQMSQVLSIPKPYYDRMRSQAPDLLAANVNHWLQAQPATKLIRTLDGGVRAILSDSYRPLDNVDLAQAILPALYKLEAKPLSCEVTERRLYIKAVTERIKGTVLGQEVQAGVLVSNSEIGEGALQIAALTYKLSCLNGAVHESAIRKAHLGRSARGQDLLEEAREYFTDATRQADDKAFFLKVQDASRAVFDQGKFDKRLLVYLDASQRKIEPTKAAEVVEVTAKRFGLNEDESKGVLGHLIQGGDLSAWGLGNAITRAAQDVESYDRSTELERFGGDVFELPQAAWKVLAS